MVGGIDRYYQIARCLRDEDLRADRQYEFMQLDAEASFVTQDDVLEFICEAVLDAAEAVLGERPAVIERMTWHDAMDRYGVDKPDLRFGMELVELTAVFAGTEFKAFARRGAIKGLRVPAARGDFGRNQLDALTDRAKALGAKGLVWMRVGDGGALEVPVAKFLSDAEQAALVAALGARGRRPAAARRRRVDDNRARCSASCATTSAGRPCTRARTGTSGSSTSRCSWAMSDDGHPEAGAPPVHAARTPTTSTASRPTRCRCARRAYDLVLNGWELGSGSIRIHEPELQQRIFDLLGIGEEEAQRSLRLLPHAVPLRRPAPRRLRVRHRPPRRDPRRRGEHPRGHRVPEDAVGRRPHDRLADARRPEAARHPRPATAAALLLTAR